jgi:hypothetical protein
MSDAATNFARGAELQSSLMARMVQANIAQQQAEQQRAMLPLRLQSMEVKNEMNRLRITAQGYKNQVDAAKVSDQETLAGGLAALASGRDPGQLTLKTPEANSAWLNAKAHSAVGRTLASVTENFVNRVSAKGLPPDLVSKALAFPKGPDGTIAPEAWKALDMAETVAAQQASAERNAAEKSRSDLRMGEDKARIELQNEGRLEAVTERAKLSAGRATGTGATAASTAAFGVKKASFLRQVDVIKADPTLSSDAKMARIEELQQRFEAEIGTSATAAADPGATPTPAPAPMDPSVRDEIEINNEQIKTLLRQKADIVSRMAAGEGGKTLGIIGDGYQGKLKSTQQQIEALRAQNASLASGAAAPALTSAAGVEPRKMVVKQDGTTVRDGNVVFKPATAVTTAAPSASQPQPAPTTAAPAATPPAVVDKFSRTEQGPLSPNDELMAMIKSNTTNPMKSKNPVAAAFWEVVAEKLNVQPESVGGSVISRKPRTVAMSDPRIKAYYEKLPAETKNAIMSEVIERARANPDEFIPGWFDYMYKPK